MEKNIFEGAKFGDKFVTRSGKSALYINNTSYITIGRMHNLVTEDFLEITVCDDGLLDYEEHTEQWDDIVSKYHEDIDEEKLEEIIDMTEDFKTTATFIRSKTGYGMMGVIKALEMLIDTLSHHPMVVMDNNPYKLKITWEKTDN